MIMAGQFRWESGKPAPNGLAGRLPASFQETEKSVFVGKEFVPTPVEIRVINGSSFFTEQISFALLP
jgi:hypothetical protein